MRKIVRVSLGIVVTSLLVAVGCGDDDDSSPGGDGGSSSGGASTGGSTVKGGAGGATTGGASTGGRASGGGNTGGNTSGGAGGVTDTTECEAIGELCHPVDDVNGPLHSCHELGHTGDAAICHERFGACVTACVGAGEEGEGGASAGGATSVGGAGGGGASGDGQSPYCLALGELCHPVASISAALEECHEIGHIGDAPVCEMRFSDCASACLAAREAGEGGGNGGAGGMGAGGMSAGGGGAGGAG